MTFGTLAENQFVWDEFSTRGWIGLIQAPGSPAASGWSWIDGTAFSFANWDGGEPNDFGGSESYGEMGQASTSGWNDVVNTWGLTGYYVEFEAADMAVPAPASTLLVMMGLGLIAAGRRRTR